MLNKNAQISFRTETAFGQRYVQEIKRLHDLIDAYAEKNKAGNVTFDALFFESYDDKLIRRTLIQIIENCISIKKENSDEFIKIKEPKYSDLKSEFYVEVRYYRDHLIIRGEKSYYDTANYKYVKLDKDLLHRLMQEYFGY